MHPFALSRADDAAKAIAAHAIDPRLAFIAGAPISSASSRTEPRIPSVFSTSTACRHGPGRGAVGRQPPHRRAGADERRGGGPERAPVFSRDCGGAAVRRVGPAPQYGVDGREHHAADLAVPASATTTAALQQAAAGLRLLGPSRAQSQPGDLRVVGSVRRHSSFRRGGRPGCARRRRDRAQGRPGSGRLPSPIFTVCPAKHRSATTRSIGAT